MLLGWKEQVLMLEPGRGEWQGPGSPRKGSQEKRLGPHRSGGGPVASPTALTSCQTLSSSGEQEERMCVSHQAKNYFLKHFMLSAILCMQMVVRVLEHTRGGEGTALWSLSFHMGWRSNSGSYSNFTC